MGSDQLQPTETSVRLLWSGVASGRCCGCGRTIGRRFRQSFGPQDRRRIIRRISFACAPLVGPTRMGTWNVPSSLAPPACWSRKYGWWMWSMRWRRTFPCIALTKPTDSPTTYLLILLALRDRFEGSVARHSDFSCVILQSISF